MPGCIHGPLIQGCIVKIISSTGQIEPLTLCDDAVGVVTRHPKVAQRCRVDPRRMNVHRNQNHRGIAGCLVQKLCCLVVCPQTISIASPHHDRIRRGLGGVCGHGIAHSFRCVSGRGHPRQGHASPVLGPQGEVHVFIPQAGGNHALFEINHLVIPDNSRARGDNLSNCVALDDQVHQLTGWGTPALGTSQNHSRSFQERWHCGQKYSLRVAIKAIWTSVAHTRHGRPARL